MGNVFTMTCSNVEEEHGNKKSKGILRTRGERDSTEARGSATSITVNRRTDPLIHQLHKSASDIILQYQLEHQKNTRARKNSEPMPIIPNACYTSSKLKNKRVSYNQSTNFHHHFEQEHEHENTNEHNNNNNNKPCFMPPEPEFEPKSSFLLNNSHSNNSNNNNPVLPLRSQRKKMKKAINLEAMTLAASSH